ncbi:MAG: 3-oxoacyl-[acyl-carrier-protein] synthase III C-terminal domain-containing protein [Chthoniobacterales bacterium]
MYLHAIATANPETSLTQRECLALLQTPDASGLSLSRRTRLMLSTILRGNSGIDTRQFATRDVSRLFRLGADELNEEFRHAAPRLATAALERALAQAGLDPADLDALIICTCTGYLCPGVSSYVAEMMGLRPDLWMQDLVGLGCGAALPSLRMAQAVLAAQPDANVACVAVEICSAAFYLDDDPGVIVSACLFGDGAAATIWRSTPGGTGLRCADFDTHHDPTSRDRIRFEQREGKLRNLLHPSVPELAAGAVSLLHRRTCASDRPGPARVLAHAGGKDVIATLERALPGHDLEPTRAVLRRHGNMSSPSVLFALQEALQDGRPAPGQDWWLVSFGAGFSAHSCRIVAD